MIVFYMLLLLLIIIPVPHVKLRGGVYDDYFSLQETTYIKGIFVILVLLRHIKSYITINNSIFDYLFSSIDGQLGQLIVTLFFFYSGYGIYESVKIKGKSYIDSFYKKRLLSTWINFAVCVSLFLIEGLLMGERYRLKTVLLSYVGWETLGNSNWFIFVTLCLYVLFIFVFWLGDNKRSRFRLFLFTVATTALTIALYFVKESWWWDTMFCFPAGMWFSKYKINIDKLLTKNKINWSVMLATMIIAFLVLYKLPHIFYPFLSIVFCLIVVLLTMKIKIRNPILSFLGKHVFSIYMLQRFWYILFSKCDFNKYIFVIISICAIIISAVVFDYLADRIKSFLCR